MPLKPVLRLGLKRLLPVLLAAVALAACQDLREVRKVLDGTQESSPTAKAPPPVPGMPSGPPAEPRPQTATAPLPQLPAMPAVPAMSPPALRLTPPPGVLRMTRVALLLPLSGPEAKAGQALLAAAQLAVFSLAGDSFALMPIDTRGTPEGAEAAVRRAIDDGARLVLGPLFSSSVAAAAPIARAAGVQMVSFSNDRAVAGNGVYVMGFTPETQISRVTGFAAARGVTRVAAILPANVFGDRVEQALRDTAAATGITVTHAVRYPVADTATLTPIVRQLADYEARRALLRERRRELEGKTDEASRRALKRLEGRDTLGDVRFDAVLMPEGIGVLRALAPLLAFHDVDPRKVRMIGTVQWDDPAVLTEPSLFGGWFPAPPAATRRSFDKLYRSTYGETPPRLASLAYDATALAAVLVRNRAGAPPTAEAGGATPAALPPPVFTVDALTAPNGFAGVDGIFRLLPSGLVERGLAIKEVRNRQFVVVSPAPTSFEGAN